MMETFNLIKHTKELNHDYRVIWVFNIGVEKYWNPIGGVVDKKEDIVVNHSEEMMLLLAKSQDIVILRRKPSEEYLRNLKEKGASEPLILCPKNEDEEKGISELILADEDLLNKIRDIASKDHVVFLPYGISYLEEEIAAKCNIPLVGGSERLCKEINDKIYARQIAQELGFLTSNGYVCKTQDEITKAYYELSQQYKKIIIKMPCNASGKGMWIVEDESRFKTIQRIISRYSRDSKEQMWLVEGWLEKEMDFNCQLFVSKLGDVEVFSIKEQVTTDTVYVGSVFPPRMTEEQKKMIYECGMKIGKYLYEHSYSGVFGVDGLIMKNGSVVPIIEINGRFTLSSYVLFFERLFPQIQFYSFYKRFSAKQSFSYEDIVSSLKENNLFMNEHGKGIFLYTAATLDVEKIGNICRSFCIIGGDNMNEIDELYERFEEICKYFDLDEL